MAKTFIGELVLRLKNELSGQAKAAASDFDSSVDKIQRAAAKLNRTTWGGGFEEKIRKLGASTGEIDSLRKAWENLNTSFASRDLSKSMQSLEKSNFKTAALGHFAEIAAAAKDADKAVGGFHSTWKDAAKDMAVYGTTGAIMFGGINALREGVKANAELQREVFAQDNARITAAEQARIAATADRLTTQYPSAGFVNTMEMARSARAMMGDTDRGLAILPDLVKGLVALQSAKGPDAAISQLQNLLRGIDNAGKNQGGPQGVQDTRDIIAGMIRAAQIENGDLDVGKLFQFARRGKIAVPGLSTKFLATTAPAFMQDMTPEGFGAALSSAYQAFVIGSNAVASKPNIAEQMRIGIRDDAGLKGASLFGTDPYAWVKQYLVPALQNDKVDMTDNTAIAQSIAKLTRNTNASGLLTRMVEQQQQTDRLVEQYNAAAGPAAADTAAARDPFVAWKGFTESWKEFATSIKGMPEAVGGLNMLTGGIQRLSTALRDKNGWAQLGLAGATGLGVFAAWKSTTAIWGLMTAGTNLNAAAVALEAAAVSLGGGNIADAAKAGNKGWLGAGWSGVVGRVAGITSLAWLLNDIKSVGPDESDRIQRQLREQNRNREGGYRDVFDRNHDSDLRNNRLAQLIYGLMKPTQSRLFEEIPTQPMIADPYGTDIYRSATDYLNRRQQMEGLTTPYNPNTPGISQYFDQPVSQAKQAGQEIQEALSVQATPQVNLQQLQQAVALANQLRWILTGIGGAVAAAKNTVSSEMRRNFADHGVTP